MLSISRPLYQMQTWLIFGPDYRAWWFLFVNRCPLLRTWSRVLCAFEVFYLMGYLVPKKTSVFLFQWGLLSKNFLFVPEIIIITNLAKVVEMLAYCWREDEIVGNERHFIWIYYDIASEHSSICLVRFSFSFCSFLGCCIFICQH